MNDDEIRVCDCCTNNQANNNNQQLRVCVLSLKKVTARRPKGPERGNEIECIRHLILHLRSTGTHDVHVHVHVHMYVLYFETVLSYPIVSFPLIRGQVLGFSFYTLLFEFCCCSIIKMMMLLQQEDKK